MNQQLGMKQETPEQNISGGECMDFSEVTMGSATYEVTRVFSGVRTPSDLLVDKIIHDLEENPSFDDED